MFASSWQGVTTIQKFNGPASGAHDGPRINGQITARQVRLIDASGVTRGIVALRDAQLVAEQAGLDLVEIAGTSEPPVCKVMDYGKFRFAEQKKASEARRRQKVMEIKEIRLRPMIDDNDFGIKINQARRFLQDGDKVKVTLRFRGREMSHQELGGQVLARVRESLADVGKIEMMPKFEGRQMVMVMTPQQQQAPQKA